MFLNKAYKQNINFNGYSACPLKALYLQPVTNRKTVIAAAEELKTALKDENIKILLHTNSEVKNKIYVVNDSDPIPIVPKSRGKSFAQDPSIILPDGTLGVFEKYDDKKFAAAVNKQVKRLSIPQGFGGNFFIGKKDNGENYILTGDRGLRRISGVNRSDWFDLSLQQRRGLASESLWNLSQETGVKSSNIYILQQSVPPAEIVPTVENEWGELVDNKESLDFHIDMVVRPLKYPYILVNDPQKVIDESKKSFSGREHIIENIENTQKSYLDENRLTPTDKLEEDLKKQGFVPIRVPGLFSERETNYINAVVHERTNGDLVYITNSSSDKRCGSELDKLFENYIKEHVPSIKKVVFIKNHLLEDCGGIHCMVKEEPDFEKWA